MKQKDGKRKEDSSYKSKIDAKQLEIEQLSRDMAHITQEQGSYYSALHKRNATRLRDMCVRNKGVYIKLGQHLSMLDYVFPEEYTDVLKTLLNNNPHSSYTSVRQVFKKDIGSYPEDAFLSFSEEPIASASLAQVHVAHGFHGERYAVKVQHEGLLESSEGDMVAITFVVAFISSLFKGFSYNFLAREMNQNLPQELNFKKGTYYAMTCAMLVYDFAFFLYRERKHK
jgi:aarF domain-containing kinase